MNVKKLELTLGALPNLIYASHTCKKETYPICIQQKNPGLVFDYCYFPDEGCHSVVYRPALLNGRHVVDVLRAVCGPAYVSEAELDRVRREASEKTKDQSWRVEGWEGVWGTKWRSAAITAEE